MVEVETRRWVPSRGGTARLYVQNVADLIGLSVERYGTGNIANAALQGSKISNTAAREILAASVWISEADGRVHVERLANRFITSDAARDCIARAYSRDLAMAKDPATPLDQLGELLTGDDVLLRRAVAGNPLLPADKLRTLLADPDPEVRQAALANPNMPDEYRQLAKIAQ